MAFRPLNETDDIRRLADRLEIIDDEIKAWSQQTRKKLAFRLASLNLQERARLDGEVSLRRSLGAGLRRRGGEINSVYFRFARHGIFIEHGVGRGRPKGSAAANRNKQPWLSVVLPDEIEALAELLSQEYADLAAENLRFLIPGIIDTTIRI